MSMLGHMQFAPCRESATGRGGQFRTPRHIVPLWGIIRMMVEMVAPKPRENSNW